MLFFHSRFSHILLMQINFLVYAQVKRSSQMSQINKLGFGHRGYGSSRELKICNL